MKKLLLTALALLLLADPLGAATYHVKTPGTGGSDAYTCTQAQSVGTPKATIGSALACLGTSPGAGAGHTVKVYAGTYVEESHNTLPRGTSWTLPFTLLANSGDTVTIQPSTGQGPIYLDSDIGSGPWYAIVDGFVLDGVNLTVGPGIVTVAGVSHLRFQNNEVKNADVLGVPGSGVSNSFFFLGNTAGFIEVLNNEIHAALGVGHGVYNEGSNNLIEGNEMYDIGGWGVQVYNAINGIADSNVLRRNRMYRIALNRAVGAGIDIARGTNNRVSHNEIFDVRGLSNDGGVCIGANGTNTIIDNNSCYQFTWIGISADTGTNATIKNNILYTTASTSAAGDQLCTVMDGSGVCTNTSARGNTLSNNLGRLANANINVVGNPLFTSATDLSLQAGSPAIDAGAISIAPCPPPLNCTFTALFNAALPDIGAFETISFANATASTTGIIDITFGAAYAPLSTVASCANVTVRQAGVAKTCATFTNNTTNSATYRWTCAACLSAVGGDIDIAINAGKFTDSILIGNSRNQQSFALPVTAVANQISGATEVFTSRNFRQRTWGRQVSDSIDAAWIKGLNTVGAIRADDGKVSMWWQVDCTIADCPSVGFQFEFTLNGGGWTLVTDSCASNALCFNSTNSAAVHGTVIQSCHLPDSFGNCLAGAVAAQASGYPVLNLALNQTAPIQANFAIQNGLVAGTDQVCVRPKLDSGAAVSHVVTACVNVVGAAASPG